MPDRPSANDIAKIRAQIVSSSLDAELPYDLRWAVRALQGVQAPPPEVLGPELVTALTEELVARRAVELLDRLARTPHKAVAKAARTGLHRLRSQKMEVEIPAPPPEQHGGTGQITAGQSLQGVVSMYDARLQRVVWMTHEAPRGILLHQARISAEHGLLDFEAFSTTRRKFKQLYAKIGERMTVAKVDPQIARWLIEDASRRGQEAKRGIPDGYARASQMLGPAPQADHPALAIAPAAAGEELGPRLFGMRELAAWLPDQDFVRSVALRLEEVATSRIVIDDRQRQSQLASALDRAVGEYHTAERCRTARRLLLDTTHLLASVGRLEDAALVRAAADIYAQPPEKVAADPLPRLFLERVLAPRRPKPAEEAEPVTAEGVIVSPR
jgi:hypothetical protein